MDNLINQYRSILCRLILELRKVRHKRTHLKEGYSSLHNYLADKYQFSASTAKQLTNCLSLLPLVPEILTHIKQGSYSYESASKLFSLITHNPTSPIDRLVKICRNRSPKEIRKLELILNNSIPESKEILESALSDNLTRARNIFGHDLEKSTSNRALINHCVEKAIEGKIKKSISGPNNRYISGPKRKTIWDRSDGQCEFRGTNNKRCKSRWNLQIDHIIPVSHGGTNNIANLRLLCQQHNKYLAEIKLGKVFMHPYYLK